MSADQAGWTFLGTAEDGAAFFIARPGTEPPDVRVMRCPCEAGWHELSDQVRVAYENVTRGLPPDVVIAGPEGAWHVPRIYLAAHGVKADELPVLAERYGFKRAVIA